MNMKAAVALLLALALATPAAAKGPKKYYIVPPPEYDHPYEGELFMWTVKDQAALRAMCPSVNFNLGFAVACTRAEKGRCWIFLVPDAEIEKFLPLDLVKRHETAHCNGWPSDHSGARPYQGWATP